MVEKTISASSSYYRARYYDPATGRFLSEDPMESGPSGDFYPYVQNDPEDWSDADGADPQRRVTGRPDGTPNPFKKLTPDPDDPNKVIYKDPDTGKQYKKAKPPGFDDCWKKKHPQQKPKTEECPAKEPGPKPDPSKFAPVDVPNPHCIPGMGCSLGEDGYYHNGFGVPVVPPVLPAPGVPIPSPSLPTVPTRIPIFDPVFVW